MEPAAGVDALDMMVIMNKKKSERWKSSCSKCKQEVVVQDDQEETRKKRRKNRFILYLYWLGCQLEGDYAFHSTFAFPFFFLLLFPLLLVIAVCHW